MTKVWPSRISRTQTTLAAHTSLRLNKALLMELKSSGVRGRGRRTKFLVKEITVWNMHKSVNKLCRSYQHRIFGASQLSSEAPPACQQPSASHARHRHSNTLGGSAMAKSASLRPPRRGDFLSPLRIPSPQYVHCLQSISLLMFCDLVGAHCLSNWTTPLC